MARNPPDGVSVGLGEEENIFCWELMIIGPPDTLYEGGFFAAKLVFPSDFPNQPPVMTFKTPLWHPNGTLQRTLFYFILQCSDTVLCIVFAFYLIFDYDWLLLIRQLSHFTCIIYLFLFQYLIAFVFLVINFSLFNRNVSYVVFDDGRVCISILHPPGTDKFNELVRTSLIFRRIDFSSCFQFHLNLSLHYMWYS